MNDTQIQKMYNKANNEQNIYQQDLILNNIHYSHQVANRVTIRNNRDYIINHNIRCIINHNRKLPQRMQGAKVYQSSIIKDVVTKCDNTSGIEDFDKTLKYKEFVNYLLHKEATYIKLFCFNLCKANSCGLLDEETLALLTPLMDKINCYVEDKINKANFTNRKENYNNKQFRDLFNITLHSYTQCRKSLKKMYSEFL